MLFVKHHPGPPLAEFVECFWFCDNYHVPHAKERLMPDGAMSLVFNLHEDEIRVYDRDDPSRCDRLRGASIVGPHSRYFIIDTSEQRSVIGVQFHPGGAFPFLRLGPAELWNQHVALEDVWGSFANDLRCKLLEAGGAPAMFAVLERELLARAVKPFDPHPAVRYALAEFRAGVTTVSRVTDRIGLSERRFIERFRN